MCWSSGESGISVDEDVLFCTEREGSTVEDRHRVHTGSRVTILREDGRHFCYRLVSPVEANIERGQLSVGSPLGKALLGRRPGEEFSFDVPRGQLRVTLLEVEPAESAP